jgi:hypothetical protein
LRAAPAPAAQAADLIDDYARLRYGAIGTREELQARLHEAARHR